MLTGIYVYTDHANVTIEAAADSELIRFNPAETKVASVQAKARKDIPLEKGIYKVLSKERPMVTGEGIDVIPHGKNGDPDPTLRDRFQATFPGVTFASLKSFVTDPDEKGFSLA